MPQLQVCMCVFSRNRQVGVEGRQMMKRSTHCAILCIGLSFDGKIHTFVSASFVWYEIFDPNACLACSLGWYRAPKELEHLGFFCALFFSF